MYQVIIFNYPQYSRIVNTRAEAVKIAKQHYDKKVFIKKAR